MPDVHGDRATHDQHVDWTARKRTALRRPTLDCGHRNAGEVFYHAWCDRLSCSGECANGEHDCSAFAGVKSGSEEKPGGASTGDGCCDMHNIHCEQGGDECCGYCTEVSHFHRGHGGTTCVLESHGSAPADAVGDLHDVDRLVSRAIIIDPSIMFTDTTDPVADAFRAEVLRQGLTECEIDGVRQEYRDGEWTVVAEAAPRRIRSRYPRPVGRDTIDLAACNDRIDGILGEALYCGRDEGHAGPHWRGATTWFALADAPEPAAPHVDESLKPAGPLRKSGKWLSRLFPGRSTRKRGN